MFEVGCRNRFARGEFNIADAVIRLTSYAIKDPLADIASQMQDQVSNGILTFTTASPDLLRGQAVETGLNASAELGQLFSRVIQELSFDGHESSPPQHYE